MKYATALIALGGSAAAASQAAALTTVTDIKATDAVTTVPTGISYGSLSYGGANFDTGTDAILTAHGCANIGITTNTPGLPSSSETFAGTSLDIASPNDSGGAFLKPGVDTYVHFDLGDYPFPDEYGTLTFDSSGTLTEVQAIGGQISGAPEPQSWALMIAGTAMLGAAARRRRSVAAA